MLLSIPSYLKTLLLFDSNRKRNSLHSRRISVFFYSGFLTKNVPSSPLHTSVLKYEPIDALLSITKKDHRVFVDATLGLGGHSLEILSHLGPTDRLIGIDRDKENLSRAEEILSSSPNAQSSILRHANFSELEKILQETGISQIDGILYDLGVSSVHYDESER